jgi:hypothetical protein
MVSGSFAKYVTSDSIVDYAKVAEFGVKVTADGHLFSDTYLTTSNTPGTAYADKASNIIDINDTEKTKLATLSLVSKGVGQTDANVKGVDAESGKLVAPGTKNNEGITFSITGTTETAVALKFDLKGSDVYLGEGIYPDMTNGNVYDGVYSESDVFEVEDDYYPIKYHLTQTKTGGNATAITVGDVTGEEDDSENLTLQQVLDYLNGIYTLDGEKTVNVSANTDLGKDYGEFNLTWEWDFDDEDGSGTYDKEDTLLGELAYGTGTGTPLADALKAITDSTLPATITSKATLTDLVDNDTAGESDIPTYDVTPDFELEISITQID